MADGRWDLGALVKRESREEERTGPKRPIEIQSIEVVDGRVSVVDAAPFSSERFGRPPMLQGRYGSWPF